MLWLATPCFKLTYTRNRVNSKLHFYFQIKFLKYKMLAFLNNSQIIPLTQSKIQNTHLCF